MKTAAIICELNPLHKGHITALERARGYGFDSVVALMSGPFVQRGDAALYDKYTRAEAAVTSGFDLVIELPFPFACAPADRFASGGVYLASRLGAIDGLVFGSECGDAGVLETYVKRVESREFKDEYKKARESETIPPAKLRQTVYERLFGGFYPTKANDILGAEYLRAAKKYAPSIEILTYKREKGFSATDARAELKENVFSSVPEKVIPVFEKSGKYSLENGERAILRFFRESGPRELSSFEEMNSDLAARLVRRAKDARSLAEFFSLASSGSYTNARIRRAVVSAVCGMKKGIRPEDLTSSLVLAVGKKGREILRTCKQNGSISLYTKPSDMIKNGGEAAKLSSRADALYALLGDGILPDGEFLKKTPFVL